MTANKTDTKSESVTIDGATRQRILQADFANVVKKVKSGKPLSHRERRLIETQPSTPAPEGFTISALARMLGCDRATIRRAVTGQAPAATHGGVRLYTLANVEKALAAKPDKSLRDQKLHEEIRKLRLRNDKEEGKVIARADIAVRLRSALGRMRGILEQRLLNEAPTATSGLEVAQIRIKNRQILDEAIAECAALDGLL